MPFFFQRVERYLLKSREMQDSPHPGPRLSLVPLGAGDLIDRAIRFYRRNFWALVLIAAPAVIVGSFFSVVWTFLGREIFSPAAGPDSAERVIYYLFIWIGSIVIWLIESIATLVVMGGASRNFVRHLLFGEPISFRETYRNALNRLGGLLVASVFITVLVGLVGFFIFYFTLLIGSLSVMLTVGLLSSIPLLAAIASVIILLVIMYVALWLLFLVASRFAYVPQVMLVEGQSVLSAIARSTSLAGKNVRRLMALFVFTTLATYSALAILYVPLAWYAWANGVEITTFGTSIIPAWYEISYNLIWQISFVLLSPVWTIGLCLLYVDERVRAEGYDIELMAAQKLGTIPAVPRSYTNPLQPAIGTVSGVHSSVERRQSSSILGLD